jgi:S1-C subfamily serine protease
MKFRALSLILLTLSATCFAGPRAVRTEQVDVKAMMESTVQIIVQVKGSVIYTNAKTHEKKITHMENGWSGSGVVYGKSDGRTGQPTSKILTANHVLEAPEVGDGAVIGPIELRIDEVNMTIFTNDGRTCNLKPLAMGADMEQDVATAEADCDAGRVAKIATRVPERGSKIFVSGHPLGLEMAIVTDGYISGWRNQFLLLSASAAPGNSGGPVFYKGEVIGILVRASGSYPTISMATPLHVLQERIAETP